MPRIRELAITLTLAAASLFAATPGCARGAEPVADYEVTLAVKRYNEALPRVYAQGVTEPLAETATPDEAVVPVT